MAMASTVLWAVLQAVNEAISAAGNLTGFEKVDNYIMSQRVHGFLAPSKQTILSRTTNMASCSKELFICRHPFTI